MANRSLGFGQIWRRQVGRGSLGFSKKDFVRLKDPHEQFQVIAIS
jgi:hypothetical protein